MFEKLSNILFLFKRIIKNICGKYIMKVFFLNILLRGGKK